MAPFYAEVKTSTERLENLQVDAKPHSFSSARLPSIFPFKVFILGRRTSLREVGRLGMGYLFTQPLI